MTTACGCANTAGPAEVLGDALCDNDDNHTLVAKSWLLSDVPPAKILASFFTARATCTSQAFFYYKMRHWGVLGPVAFVLPYREVLCLRRRPAGRAVALAAGVVRRPLERVAARTSRGS